MSRTNWASTIKTRFDSQQRIKGTKYKISGQALSDVAEFRGGVFQGSTGRKDRQEKRNAPVMELLFMVFIQARQKCYGIASALTQMNEKSR